MASIVISDFPGAHVFVQLSGSIRWFMTNVFALGSNHNKIGIAVKLTATLSFRRPMFTMTIDSEKYAIQYTIHHFM
jgi:predicted class III extradiol MEMO1 family dioxygenase